jgi:flagellar biosynthetic protein FliQ
VNSQMVLTMGQDALLTLLMVAAPILGVVLLVGLVISLFQAVTQINEATLTFIPKLVAAMLALVDFIRRTIEMIPGSLI